MSRFSLARSDRYLQLLWQSLPWLIIIFGIVLRINQYSIDRSLWLDELFFAVNFLERDPLALMQLPLNYSSSHVAPPGFMLLVYGLVHLVGLTEPILRFLPLMCGIGALFLFERLGRVVLSPLARPIALLLFAASDSLIYYSTEFKQYSCDVFIVLALLLWFTTLQQTLTLQKRFLLATVGALVLWFSHPAAFVLAAIGLWLGLRCLWQRHWHVLPPLLGIGVLWLGSFVLMFYFVGGTVKDSEVGRWLIAYWHFQQGFMPTLLSAQSWDWLVARFFALLHYPANLYSPVLTAWLMLVGGVTLLLRQRYHYLFLFFITIVLALLASHFEKYPFTDRLMLFAVPFFYILVAEGIASIQFSIRPFAEHWLQQLAVPVVNLLLLVIILLYIINSTFYLEKYRQEIKPVLSHVQQHKQPNDKFYIYHWAEPALRFYGKNYGLSYDECVLINAIPTQPYTKEIDFYRKHTQKSVTDLKNQTCILGVAESFQLSLADIEKMRSQGRVWFIFSHTFLSERQRFVDYLDRTAKRLDTVITEGSAAFLYHM